MMTNMTTMMMMTVDNHQERETKDNIIVQNTRVLFCWIDALSLSLLSLLLLQLLPLLLLLQFTFFLSP